MRLRLQFLFFSIPIRAQSHKVTTSKKLQLSALLTRQIPFEKKRAEVRERIVVRPRTAAADRGIGDNCEKIVLTNGRLTLGNYNGIKV